jgi:hypothetical protein
MAGWWPDLSAVILSNVGLATLTVAPGVGEKSRKNSVVSASIQCLSLSMDGADGAFKPGMDHSSF